MYISLTKRYLEYLADDCEWVFTPNVFDVTFDKREHSWELTEEGEIRASQYLEDSLYGYDLCNGRAVGLAKEYTDEQMFLEIITSSEYVFYPENEDFNIYEIAV